MAGRDQLLDIGSAEDFARTFNVSRETIEKLQLYSEKLVQWQKAVNLVAPKTLDDLWQRHFADSAQLARFAPPNWRHHADFGSGGGFPGLVLAIILLDRVDRQRVTLVESDQRKAAFLREVARVVDKPVEIISTRIESDATVKQVGSADFITARALAPLSRLFELTLPYCSQSAILVFPKGRMAAEEISEARAAWEFDCDVEPSRTDTEGRIVVVRGLRRKN